MSIQLLTQPNEWTCLPTSLAMLGGFSVDYIINEIGHDGSEVLVPSDDINKSYGRRCFTDMEILYVGEKLGLHLMPFMCQIELCVMGFPDEKRNYKFHNLFSPLFNKYSGIIMSNKNHAMVWDHEQQLVLNPYGSYKTLNEKEILIFYAHIGREEYLHRR